MRITLVVYIYHATGFSLLVEFINAHCKLCAVGKIEGDRILAANIVANLYRTGLNLKADLLEFLLEKVVEKHCL